MVLFKEQRQIGAHLNNEAWGRQHHDVGQIFGKVFCKSPPPPPPPKKKVASKKNCVDVHGRGKSSKKS